MFTLLMTTSTRVGCYADTAIIIAIVIYFILRIRNYNRAMEAGKRRDFLAAFLVGSFEWLATWLWRLMIVCGLILHLLLWYNR